MKNYTLPENYQQKIETLLNAYGYSLEKPHAIAQAILKLSDHYQERQRITPWKNPEFIAAYAAYFFPLNYIRNLKVWDECQSLQFPKEFSQVIDYGCGLGSSSLAAIDNHYWNSNTPLYTVDHDAIPIQLLQKYLLPEQKTSSEKPAIKPNALGVFSYSFNELPETPKWLYDLDHIVLVEPSTSAISRKLMQFRDTLIAKGYNLWAPCTHALACPLLEESKTDWCHDRVHWTQPDWFKKMEALLPIKNTTLTMSYLIASKTPSPHQAFGRIVGDELKEKGKMRWMFCRSSKREFLSHLDRYGDPPDWKRGHLFLDPLSYEEKGNELRVKK